MEDKLKKLYDLYVQSGLIKTTDFKSFTDANDQQRKKLYDLGKQNGLFKTTDYNTFNNAFNVNTPVKKKSTTGSQSVQKKKPTSSVTPVSWMQESLVSSSSQEQKKKPTTKTTEAPVVAKKETIVEQVIPGQEQTRMNNGKLERLYNGIWVDASAGGREVGTISKSVQQSRKEDENIFTGYPGKEKNEYRVYNDVWQRRQPGKKEWTTIINEQSVNALNKQFNKEVKIGSNINVQLRRDSERKELDNRLATVSSKLIDQEEQAVIKILRRQFPNFKFIEEGTFTDGVIVESPDGNDKIKISLDNWTFDDDRAEAVNLREFIRKNSNNDLNEAERKEIEAKKDREYFDVKPFYPTIQIGDGYGDEKIVTDPSQISTEPKQKMNIMTADQNLKVATKEFSKEYANAFLDVQERARISAKTEGKLDDKEVSAAYASLDHNVKTAKIADRYFQDVSAQSKELKKQFSEYSTWVDEINERAKAGDISKEEYENTYVPQMKEELERLKGMSTQLNDEYSTSNNMIKSIEKATAENYIIQESKGSFGGGVAYNFTKGLTDIARIATFGNFDARDQEAIVRLIVGEGTTKEYMSSENRSDLTKVLFSLATSLGQAASGGIVGRGVAAIGGGTKAVLAAETLPFYSGGYYEMKDQFDDPKFKNVSDFEKVMYSTLYGVTSAILEKYGLTKSISKTPFGKSLTSSILSTAIKDLPKDATEQMIKDAVESSVLNKLKSASVNTLGAFVVEASTESAQKVTELALQETFDWIHGNEKEGYDKFKNGTWKDMFVNTLYEGYLGGLGGGVMQIASSSISGITEGLTKTLNKDQIQVLDNMVKIDGMVDSYDSYLKGMVVNGDLTPDEAREMSASFREVKGNFDKIPDNIAPEEKAKAFDLMIERSKIEKEIIGKDESLVAPQKARIAEINNELKTISEDATKKSTEQEVTAEGGGVQREGAVEGQPEVGQGEGTVGQATEQGADLGDSTVKGRSQEEEIKKLRADEQAELTEAIPNIEEYKVDGEIDKASMPEDVLAKYDEIYNKYDAKITPLLSAPQPAPVPVPVPTIAETTDTKTYSEALSAAKAELKAEGNGLDLQVSDVSQEEADAIVKEGGKIFMTEDGLAGAYVKKDGYMGGLFKSPKATYKEVAKLLQQARIKVGGKFMDAYATELEKIYVKNGFRPIARMKFNEEYAPEGWDAPGSALAGKPDVVFFAYDPEGKYKIGDGEYVEDYDAAYEMAKNFDAKAANEADKLAAILDKKATVSKGVISKEEVSKRVTLAQKALSAILPDVKFIVHDTDEAFREAVGEMNMKEQSSAGAYDMDNKVIHINGTKANKRTVSHEVFHAIIISKAASDVQLQKLTANMVNSVLKSLKQTGTNQDVINYLEKFAAAYKDDPTVMNEEKLAELHGILGENMIELPLPTQNIIKRFFDRLAKMFGLKEMTDREAVEFMNTMSSKVETGEEITDKEFKGESLGRGTINIKSPRKSKFIDSLVFERFPTNENTRVIENFDISNIDGQVAASTLSDKLTAGRYKNVRVLKGQEIVDAEYIFFGGVGYPEVTGYVWAASRMSDVQKIIDSMVVSEDGYRYLMPAIMSNTSHMSNKNMTSITMEVFKEAIANNELNRTKFKEIVSKAFSNKRGIKFKDGAISAISGNISATQMCDNLKEYIMSSKMTFEARKDILKSMVGDPASGNPKFSTVGTYLSLATSLSEPMAKDADTHQVVVVIRTKGNLTPKKTDKKDPFYHESYGFHIESDQEIEVLHLDATYNLVDIIPEFTNNEGKVVSTEQELKEKGTKGWSIKRILTNLGRTHGLAKYSAKISAPKKKSTDSGVRQQKPLTTDKDVHPGYETALEALGETEAQREQWRSENKVNQKQKRNPIVEKAVKDYYNEEITQEEYLEIVAKNQPIKLFKKVPSLPTNNEIVNSLDKNKVSFGIIGVTKNLNDGEKVASRLDIPAYEDYDTWVVSIHDGAKEGKSIAYAQTSVLKDVNFKTFPGPAIRIAMGTQNKSTIARMFGSWVNESPESVHARAEDLMNDPEWVQVGMNPFRHSWFYDKSDGMPLASAEEVVQVGALVLAKNPVKVEPSDPMFETKSSKGGKIRFQKPQVGETVEVYGSEAKVTAVDGDMITFEGKDISGDIDYKISSDSILNEPTPKAQIEKEVKTLEEEMKPKINKSKIRKQIVGENANLAQNVRDNLDVARQMEAGKKSKKDVRIATGWERGADKKWRYEIDDNINDWIQGIIKNISSSKNIEADSNFPGEKNQSVSLNKLLPKIITESYPEINKMDINVTFDTNTNDSFYDGKKKINVGSKSPAMIFTIAYNLIHEIQHVIQGIEGFARGTSTNNLNPESKKYSELENEILNSTNYGGIGSLIYDLKQEMDKGSFKSIQLKYDTSNLALKGFLEKKNYDGDILNDDLRSKMLDLLSLKNKSNQQVTNDEYLRYAGEVEARNVEERVSMTPEERRQTTLEETEDVSREDQIIFFEGSKFRKQKASKQAAVIVKKGKEANLSDAGIREYMKRNGYTDRQATDAIQAYNDKQEGIFIDPDWSKLRRAAVVFKRKFLSARGLMPNSAFALNENRQADIAKSLNMAEKTIVDFNRAMKKVAKNDREQVRKDFDAYIRGDKTVNLPVDLKKVADTMRAHIDSMSESLINSGLVDEHTTEKITDNLGSYLTRSYKVYDRANWGKEVEAEIKQKAINFLKVQYTPMAKEIAAREGMDVDDVLDTIVTNKFNEILTKEGAENFITGGKMGSKNLSILKERQDIPLEIRMLMGEYTDPAQNYAKTILKMSALAANHQFLTEVKKNGTGVFLFEKNDPRRPKGFDYMIAAEGSETMNPLNGMYTTKEIKEEFEKQPAQLGAIMETYMRALSLVKWGKTIGSLMTHAKNVFGNIGFVLLNGHWRVNEMGRAYKTVKNDLFSRDKAGLRDYMNRLIELGIVKQSAGIGELRAMFKDADWDTAMIERINKNTGSKWDWVKSKFSKGAKFIEDLYQSEDDFFKIVAYENELSRYSKAMFGKPKTELTESERAEVDQVVAEIVKNTYPTYSRIPELVNMIRRFPFVGNFISFQAESYRTAFNTAALSLDEIKSKNTGVRQIGAQRLVGSITYLSAKTAILSAFSYAAGMGAVGILGYFTDDEEEKKKENDVRKFVAPWSKDSDLIVLKANNGKIQYIDFSSSDPHGGINKAINSFFSKEKNIDGLINALGSTIEPFIGEEMTTAAILAVKNNQNAYGKPIYNPEDTFFEKSKDISAYMLNVVQPGTVSTARKMYESDSKLNEAVGAATGMRIYDVDVAESFGYSMISYRNRIEEAKRIYNSEVYNKDATEKSISSAKKRAENAMTEINKEIYDAYYSAVRLGANDDVLVEHMKAFGRMSTIDMKFMFAQVPYLLREKAAPEEE